MGECSKTYGMNMDELALAIARGEVEGSEPFGAYGERVNSTAGTNQLLWADGTWYIPNQSTGEQVQIQSTSANDTVGGTGINSIDLHYLDDQLIFRTEIVPLNGTTPVFTTATNIRFIQCGHMVDYGSLKSAAGNITFTRVATPTQIFNQINATYNRCSSSARMVPAGKRAVIYSMVGSCTSGAGKDAKISIAATYFQGHDYTVDAILIPFGSIAMQDSGIPLTLKIPFVYYEGVVIAMTYTSSNAGLLITGDWFGWIEDVT